MRLLALVESPEHVCCRYRLAAFRPALQEAGHSLELRPFPTNWWSWLHLGRDLGAADVVILQRKLLPAWQLLLLRRAARRLVFDFDDAVFLRDSYSPRGLQSDRRLRRFAALARQADALVAGNDVLARQAALVEGSRRISIIPTCVDPGRYPLAEHERRDKGVQLVWVGSSSTLQGLERILPLLESIGEANPGTCLKLICDRFLYLRQLPVLACRWSEGSEAAEIAAADIGISWLPDDAWSHGKCGLKVLQYMAAGLPVIANPVGVQADLVRHGETGFLAETPEEWAEAVGRLARAPELRRHMGRAGRQRVETDFSVASGATKWQALLTALESRRAAA